MTADVISLHVPTHISKPVNAALGKLASQLLPEAERRLDALLETGERIMGAIQELVAELRDEKTPDYARDLASHKLIKARIEYHATVQDAAHCIRQIDLMRKQMEAEPHFVRAVIDALIAPEKAPA